MFSRPDRPTARRGHVLAVLALTAALALTGCGSSEESAASAPEAPMAEGLDEQSADDGGTAAEAKAGGNVLGGAADAAGQRRIRTAELTVQVDDLPVAAERVRQVATTLGGFVSSEATSIGESVDAPTSADGDSRTVQPGSGVLVLRVPEPDLDAAMARVADVGTEVARTQHVQDVTGQVADLNSRIKTQQESIARTRALLAKANSLQDLAYVESELTRREADLEALQARLKSLSDRADLATLTATLQVPGSPADDEPSTGFLAGLRHGWSALLTSTNIVVTLVGAVLPVAVVLAVIAVPVNLLLRRRTARRAGTQQPTTPSSGIQSTLNTPDSVH